MFYDTWQRDSADIIKVTAWWAQTNHISSLSKDPSLAGGRRDSAGGEFGDLKGVKDSAYLCWWRGQCDEAEGAV